MCSKLDPREVAYGHADYKHVDRHMCTGLPRVLAPGFVTDPSVRNPQASDNESMKFQESERAGLKEGERVFAVIQTSIKHILFPHTRRESKTRETRRKTPFLLLLRNCRKLRELLRRMFLSASNEKRQSVPCSPRAAQGLQFVIHLRLF